MTDLFAPLPQRTIVDRTVDAALNTEGGMAAQARNDRAQRESEKAARENASFGALVGAYQVSGGIGFLDRVRQEAQVDRDPDWILPENFRKDMEESGIDSRQWELFNRAGSEEHYQLLKTIALQNQMAAEERGNHGILANLAAGMTDPVAFGLDAITGGLAMGARAGRLANAVRSGVAAASTNVAMTGMAGIYDPEVDLSDYAVAAAAGLAIGGVLGARRGDDFVLDSRKVEDLAKRDLLAPEGSQGSMGAARVAGLPESPTPGLGERSLTDAMQAHVDRGVDELDIKPAMAPIRMSIAARMGKRKDPTARGVGRWLFRDGVGYTDRNRAVEQSATELASLERAVIETKQWRGYNAAYSAAREARGVSAWNRQAEVEFNAEVADVLRGVPSQDAHVNDAAKALREVLDETWELAERAGIVEKGMKNTDYFPQIQSRQAYQRMFGEVGISEDQAVEVYKQSILSQMRKDAPAETASKFHETEALYKGTSDAALRARERAEDLQKTIGDRQQALRDAEERIEEVKDMPGKAGERARRAAQRRWEEADRKLQRAYGRLESAKASLDSALKREDAAKYATQQAKAVADDAGIDEELAELYARAIINRGKGKLDPVRGEMIQPLNTESLEELKMLLEEAGASAEKIASVLGRYTTKVGEESRIGASKKRIRLDPEFKMQVTNRFGKDVEVRVTDFMENDASRVVLAANREMIGWAAMAQRGNVRNPAELKALRDLLAREAQKAGDNPDSTLRMFDIGVNSTFGRSTEVDPNSTGARIGRAVRDTQFIRVMNQVGFTLFTELGPVVAHAGFMNTLRSVRHLPDMLRRMQDGKLSSGEARYLEDLVATGTEHIRNPAFLRLDGDAYQPPVYGDSKFGRGMENLTMIGQRFTSIASGMAPLNAALQRLAGRATLMKLLQLANQTRPLSEGMTRRLRGSGLTEEMQEALFGALRGKKSVDDIAETDLPLEVRETLAAYMFRVTRHQVLEGDVSDSIGLMHGTAGKLIMQFRSFMAYSYERHFLNSVYHWKDWNTYMMVMLSASLAGIQWSARTYLNNIHDEERRRELLTQGNFVRNAVANSSWGGIVPAITDTVAPLLGEEPVFAGSRSSGLSANLVLGIPAVDHGIKLAQAAQLPMKALRTDQEVETRDLQNLSKVFWLQNLTGWQNIQNLAIKEAEEAGLVVESSRKNRELARERRKDREASWQSKYLFDIQPGD